LNQDLKESDQNPHVQRQLRQRAVKPDAALLYLSSGQNPRDVALMAQFLSEKNPNLKTVVPHHHRLDPPPGRTPADLGKAMAALGLKAELIDPKPGVVYTLSK